MSLRLLALQGKTGETQLKEPESSPARFNDGEGESLTEFQSWSPWRRTDADGRCWGFPVAEVLAVRLAPSTFPTFARRAS